VTKEVLRRLIVIYFPDCFLYNLTHMVEEYRTTGLSAVEQGRESAATPEAFKDFALRFAQEGRTDLTSAALGATGLSYEEKLDILATAHDNKAVIQENLARLLQNSTVRDVVARTTTLTMTFAADNSRSDAKVLRQTRGFLSGPEPELRARAQRDARFLLGEDKPWAKAIRESSQPSQK
jgi:hypothetical protein